MKNPFTLDFENTIPVKDGLVMHVKTEIDIIGKELRVVAKLRKVDKDGKIQD